MMQVIKGEVKSFPPTRNDASYTAIISDQSWLSAVWIGPLLGCCALFQAGGELLDGDRPGEQEALVSVATFAGKKCQLLLRFDALRNDA